MLSQTAYEIIANFFQKNYLCTMKKAIGTGTMPVHARKRVSEKEDREKRHAGLLEKLDRDANAARLYEWERKWDMVITAGFGFSTWLSHSEAVPLTDPDLSWNAGLRTSYVYENGWTLGFGARYLYLSILNNVTALEQGLGLVGKTEQTYLDIPMYAGFRFACTKRVDCQILIGPYVSCGIDGKINFVNYDLTPPEEKTIELFEGMNRYDIGLNAHLDFDVSNFVFGVEGRVGFLNLDGGLAMTNGGVMLNFGYRFHLN